MIILSQDKTEIINFDNVSFLDIDESNGNYYVMANFDSIYETIGIYKTEERAKEVLNKIIDYMAENGEYLAQIGDLNMRYKGIAEDTINGKRQMFYIERKINE